MSYTNEGDNYRKYGIVIIESYDKALGYKVYKYRKPTIKERQEIILNYIIQNNNEPIDLIYLSNKLCVSKRNIQKDITGKELTLELLYDLDNPYQFRDFVWKEFKMNPSMDNRILNTLAYNQKQLNILLAYNQKQC